MRSGSPAAAARVTNRSSWLWMALETLPEGILPGQRTIIGTRTPPSQVVPFSPRKGE